MEQKHDIFPLDEAQRRAAQLLAEGKLTDQEIADSVDISRTTLWRWRKHPEFAAEIETHLEAFRAEVRRRGIADQFRRVKAQNDRWNRLQRVIEARADDPDMKDVPGGDTGLIVKTVKVRSTGEGEVEKTIKAEVDVGLLKELREHEKLAAQELGQWVERQEIAGDDAKPVVVKVLRGVSLSDI